MEKLNKKLRTVFIFALALSIGFVAGIPLTVVGGVKDIPALLGIGIALIALGFYVMPILWVTYATKKRLRRVINAVEQENIYTPAEMAQLLSVSEKNAADLMRECLIKSYITGYKWENDKLVLNRNVRQGLNPYTVKCDNCGAPVTINPLTLTGSCAYCGALVKEARPPQ